MKAIIQSDDFGLSFGFTEAIKDCFLLGNISSTSIRTNGMAYKYAVKLLKNKLADIGLGIHLNLVDGPAHQAALADSSGNYKFNFLQYLLLAQNNKFLKDVEAELDWQFQQVLKNGLKVDHVSGHNHTYIIPPIFAIVCQLCRKYQIKSIRLPSEPYYLIGSLTADLKPLFNLNIIKFLIVKQFSQQNKLTLKKYHLKTTDAFYGVLHTDNMSFEVIKAALQDAKTRGFKTIEILGHPAYSNDPRDKTYTSKAIKDYIHSANRRLETATFQTPQLADLLKETAVETTSYRNLWSLNSPEN